MFVNTKGAARPTIALSLAAFLLASCGGGTGPRIDVAAPIPVALLVPSGSGQASDEALASSLENAARLAMADLRGVTIDLRVYPTAGSAEIAADAADRAVDEGAGIILGPVYASTAKAAGAAVSGRGINVLAFTNNPDAARRNVFVLGHTFENTADRLVRFSLSRGLAAIRIVHGNDAAERKGRDAIRAAISRSAALNVGVSSFELNRTAVVEAAPEIALEAQDAGAQAVFLTSGTAGALPILSGQLRENGLDEAGIQLVGLQRWDLPSSALALPGLQGGWFAVPDPDLVRQFSGRYRAAYGASPHAIASLAYDGIAVIGALALQGSSSGLSASALTQSSGFAGASGALRFRRNGTNERALAVATIRNKRMAVIDPAPRRFGGAGF